MRSLRDKSPVQSLNQSGRGGVLLLSDDMFTPASKTTYFMAQALRRLGYAPQQRDTHDAKLAARFSPAELSAASASERRAVATLHALIERHEIHTIMGLDLHWLFSAEAFLEHPCVERIFSIWFDDPRTACVQNRFFSAVPALLQNILQHPKLTHVFYGTQLAREAAMLGLTQQKLSGLAAPLEYTEEIDPGPTQHRLAFVGGPGLATAPGAGALAALQRKAEWSELRHLARAEFLQLAENDGRLRGWSRDEPSVRTFLEAATERRCRAVPCGAAEIIGELAGEFPRAVAYLNERGQILDVLFLIKLVNRYDRPALVHRLYGTGLLDVFSSVADWAPYGISAQPAVPFPELPGVYRRYLAQVNGANPGRDAPANEKLFEIAACGRASFNLRSPDLLSYYEEDELVLVDSLEELESRARELVQQPEILLQIGRRAHEKTRQQHTWDHRFATLLSAANPDFP